MNPLDRKLFKSRDARNTLRGMGGILSSSPELAQTVQKYKDGGPIRTPSRTGLERMEADPIRQGRATRIGDRTFVMLPNGVVLDARTQAAASPEETLAVQRRLNAFPERDPVLSEENLAMRVNPSFETDTRDRAFGIGISDRSLGDPAPLVGAANLPSAEEPFADISALRTPPNMPPPGTADDLAFQRMSVGEATSRRPGFRFSEMFPSPDIADMSPERLEAERLAAESGGLKELGLDIVEGITGGVRNTGEFLQRNIGEGLSRMGAPNVGSFFLEGAENTADLSTRRQQEEEARDAERAARIAEIDEIRKVETGEPLQFDPARDMPPARVATPEPEPEVEVPAPIEEEVVDTPDVEDPASDFDTSYANAMKRLSGVMGEGADEDSKKKAMANLAMIGLAIAAGQSPDALTNIAQGALTGMQGIQKADAAKEAQRKELELAAIQMAQTADEKRLDRENALAVAGIRNAAGLDTKTGEVTYRTLFNEAYKVATDLINMPPQVRSGELSPEKYADSIARAALAGSQGAQVSGTVPRVADPGAVDAAIRSRVEAAKDDPNALAAIRQSLVSRGMDPSKYGLK